MTQVKFNQLALSDDLLKALDEAGLHNLTAVQQRAIPAILAGRDVLVAAQTGTGKTAAFGVPLIEKLLPEANDSLSPAKHQVKALILAPTRELVSQIAEQIQLFARFTTLKVAVVYGGVAIKEQQQLLQSGVEILVATPGRLLDHCGSMPLLLHHVKYVVLDEADRMLDIGFLPDLTKILSFLPQQRFTSLFSATFSKDIKRLANKFLTQPLELEISPANTASQTIEQKFFAVGNEGNKRIALCNLLRQQQDWSAFIFTNSKANCAQLARYLQQQKFNAAAIHGNMTQQERLAVLQDFKDNKLTYLVATDVAARGLDIKDVPLVVNYDLPYQAEDYIHRIGRTGRAGLQGLACSLVTEQQRSFVAAIEDITKQKITLESFEVAAPEQRRRAKYKSAVHSSDPIFDNFYQEEVVTDKAVKTPVLMAAKVSNKKKTLAALFVKG